MKDKIKLSNSERFVGMNSKNLLERFWVGRILTKQPRWSLLPNHHAEISFVFAVTLTRFPTFFFFFFYFSSFLTPQRNSISLFHWVCVIPFLFSILRLPFFFFHFNFPFFPFAFHLRKIGWKGIVVFVIDFLSVFSWNNLLKGWCWIGLLFLLCSNIFPSRIFRQNHLLTFLALIFFLIFYLAFLLRFPFSLYQLVGIL